MRCSFLWPQEGGEENIRGKAVSLGSTSMRVRSSGSLLPEDPAPEATLGLLGPAIAVGRFLEVGNGAGAGLLVVARAWLSISSSMLKSKSSSKSDIIGDEGAFLVTRVGAVLRRVGDKAIESAAESTAVLAFEAKYADVEETRLRETLGSKVLDVLGTRRRRGSRSSSSYRLLCTIGDGGAEISRSGERRAAAGAGAGGGWWGGGLFSFSSLSSPSSEAAGIGSRGNLLADGDKGVDI